MKLERVKIIIDQKEVKEATPELIAELFSEMFSDEQARFFNHLGEITSKWKWGDMSMQLQYITDEDGLTLAGRRVMDGIGNYSHWGLQNNWDISGKD